MFPERDRVGRRFLVLAVVASLFIHLFGGSLWALLQRETRHATIGEDVLAKTEPIVIEQLPQVTPAPTPSTPRPQPPAAVSPPKPVVQPPRRASISAARVVAPRVRRPLVRPKATVVAQQVPVGAAAAPHHAAVDAPTHALDARQIAALDATFRSTIAQAQRDVATAPQMDAVVFNGGDCMPLGPARTQGEYRYYFISCAVRYSDGFRERVAFPWEYKFLPHDDPFAQADGREHNFPPQGPPSGFVLARPFVISRAVCAYFHDACVNATKTQQAAGSSVGAQ